MIRRALAMVALALPIFSAGCGALTMHHVLTGAPAPAFGGDVRVVMEGSEGPSGFVEIAIVQAHGTGQNADLEHVIDGLRVRAAALGCDTIVRVRVDQGVSNASASGVCGRTR